MVTFLISTPEVKIIESMRGAEKRTAQTQPACLGLEKVKSHTSGIVEGHLIGSGRIQYRAVALLLLLKQCG